jgi:acetyl-CoA decarbonylase/synthase complex subunit gamma
VEIIHTFKTIFLVGGALFLVATLLASEATGAIVFLAFLGAVLSGLVIAPILLPWLPGRSFAFKGAAAGIAWSALYYLLADGSGWGLSVTIAAFLTLPVISAFYTLNFTGCTNFTSRSGVKKEMRIGIPIMGVSLAVGVLLLVMGRLP